MNIESIGHPEPSAAWDALEKFFLAYGRMPDGSPLSPSFVKVLTVGAWVGCRLSLIHLPFALAVAEYGNEQDSVVFASLKKGFDKSYGQWLHALLRTVLHNAGFSYIEELTDEENTRPLTEEDAQDIIRGLDEFFGGKKDA